MKNRENQYIKEMAELNTKISNIQNENFSVSAEEFQEIMKERDALRKQVNKYREHQNRTELHRLDNKAIEIELEHARIKTQEYNLDNIHLNQEMHSRRAKTDLLERQIEAFTENKIKLVQQAHAQIQELRSFFLIF